MPSFLAFLGRRFPNFPSYLSLFGTKQLPLVLHRSPAMARVVHDDNAGKKQTGAG